MSGWDTSTRRSRLPADWARRRTLVLRRDPHCRIAGPGCTGRSTEADHVIPGDNHDLSNLQGLCAPCHKAKTLAERPTTPSRRRPAPQHPGVLT